jgi:hypothetical protein
MSRYNMLQAIVMSFYSRKLYRDVAMNWGGKAFLYLLLLLALSWIGMTYLFQHGINQFYAQYSGAIVSQMPILTIKDGKMSTPENRPYLITDPDHERIAVIDATGQYTTLEQAKTDILVTQTQVISQSKPNETRTNQLPPNFNAVIDPNVINAYIKKFVGFTWIFIFILFVVSAYIYRIIQALLYGIIGKIFSSICRVPLSYGQILQIVLVAITPAIIIATIVDLLNVEFPYEMWVYFLISMFYLFYGIIANKNPEVVS